MKREVFSRVDATDYKITSVFALMGGSRGGGGGGGGDRGCGPPHPPPEKSQKKGFLAILIRIP